MRTIHIDLSARTADHCILLPTSTLREHCLRAGDLIRLHGDDVRVEARVEVRAGVPVGVPEWSTLEYTD